MAEAVRLRVPPHSVEAEQSVLGALLLDNRAFDAAGNLLHGEDFYRHEHRLIWDAVSRLVSVNRPADVVTVFEALGPRAVDVGGLAYLNALACSVPGAGNAGAYATIVRQRSILRRVIGIADEMASTAFRQDDADQVIDRAVLELMALQAGDSSADPQLLGTLLPAWIDDFSDRAEGKSDAVPFGMLDVDKALGGGARPGDLIVVASRPSMGKSAFTLKVMRSVSQVGPVLVCTMEDSASMLIARQVASLGRANLAEVRRPEKAPEKLWDAVTDALEQLRSLPIYVDDAACLDLADVQRKARHVKRVAGGLTMVVVDYLQLMEDEGETRSYELNRIVRGLKRMAKQMQCTVLLLSQLSREADKSDSPPRLDHLAESGGIEQAADIIGLLWRKGRRKPTPETKHHAQIEFAKNKNGPTDTVQLWFDGATQRFEDANGDAAYAN